MYVNFIRSLYFMSNDDNDLYNLSDESFTLKEMSKKSLDIKERSSYNRKETLYWFSNFIMDTTNSKRRRFIPYNNHSMFKISADTNINIVN